MGLSVWNQDEAGPYQTKPYCGSSWQPEGDPQRQPHEYIRNGTAKLLTLFHPATGEVRVKGVTSSANAILHPWLKEELSQILQTLPSLKELDAETNRKLWEMWQEGLSVPISLPQTLPALRMLLIWDNLRGHLTTDMVLWLFEHGILPLYTPLGGSWLNMAESMQRILFQRGLAGSVSRVDHRNYLFVGSRCSRLEPGTNIFRVGGKRAARRQRSRQRRHALGGSGAYSHRPLHRRATIIQNWQRSCQTTH